MPRPGALKHTGQAIVGDAVQRVSYSRTGRHVAKIQQGYEVYPQWLRHRVSPPKRESMPVFMRGSTSAYLLLGAVARARKSLAAQQPKLRKGRPSTPVAKQAARTKKRLAAQGAALFASRYLFVQRHLNKTERK